jgi:hypothetical protein
MKMWIRSAKQEYFRSAEKVEALTSGFGNIDARLLAKLADIIDNSLNILQTSYCI